MDPGFGSQYLLLFWLDQVTSLSGASHAIFNSARCVVFDGQLRAVPEQSFCSSACGATSDFWSCTHVGE